LVISGAGLARVEEVEPPVAGAGQVVVDVRRAGICGTDVELFTEKLAYFAQGRIGYPIRPGHEWCGVVSAVGEGVDPGWLGARVTGDTMLGCGHCARYAAGRGHVCRIAARSEAGKAHAVIRPERVLIEEHGSAGENRVPAMVERVVFLGAATQVMLRLAPGVWLGRLELGSGLWRK
jgi:threonine dehydrogenase-like Zn-dependent dehydrogenase